MLTSNFPKCNHSSEKKNKNTADISLFLYYECATYFSRVHWLVFHAFPFPFSSLWISDISPLVRSFYLRKVFICVYVCLCLSVFDICTYVHGCMHWNLYTPILYVCVCVCLLFRWLFLFILCLHISSWVLFGTGMC